MKSLILIIGSLLFIANLLLGLLISAYEPFNMWLNCGIIAVNTTLMVTIASINLNDGFRISLSSLYPIIGLVEFICGLICKPRFEDNLMVVFIIMALLVQSIILIITKYISKSVN